jgi:hypothetical protein
LPDLSTIRTEARLIFGQPDSSNSDLADAQLTIWANEFYRWVCIQLGSIPKKERAYDTPTAAAPTVALNANTVAIHQAKVYDGNQWVPIEVCDVGMLNDMDPDYENATANTPTHLVKTGTFTARLYPPPKAGIASQVGYLKTYGMEFPTALSSDTDVPDVPVNIQDLFAHWIAYRAFTRLQDKDAAANELIIVREFLKGMKNATVNFSKGMGWHWEGQGNSIVERITS